MKRNLKRRSLTCLTAAAFALVLALPSFAINDESALKVVSSRPGSVVSIYNEDYGNKEEFLESIIQRAEYGIMPLLGEGTLSSQTSSTFLSGNITLYFDDTVTTSTTGVYDISGASTAFYTGDNISSIQVTELFEGSGIQSISAGVGSWNTWGTSASVTVSVSDTWLLNHTYTGLAIRELNITIAHTCTASFINGGTVKTISTNDSAVL